jgi:enterochelin esterase-like enzyme
VAIDTDALAARVCDAVLRGLDAQLRQAVSDVLQTEHRRLMQELQIHLLPLVENRVRDALATEVAGRSQGSQKLLSGN